MTKILKISEMNKGIAKTLNETHNKKFRENEKFKSIIGGDDYDGKYKITLDGIVAMHEILLSNDITALLDFSHDYVEKTMKSEDVIFDYYDALYDYLLDNILNECNADEFIQKIENEDFYNYIENGVSMFECFKNNESKKWAFEVRKLLN